MAGRVFAFEEVAKHNKKGDCWIIISGKVYDVSPFLEEHPGGDELLLNSTGKDATVDFEDVGHSSDAMSKMEELLVGKIDKSTLPDAEPLNTSSPPTASSTATAKRDSGDSNKFLLYILPLLIMGVAFALRLYSKKEEA